MYSLVAMTLGVVGLIASATSSTVSQKSAARSIDVWAIDPGEIDPMNYFGISVANGMIGIVSAPVPFRTQRTQIAGAYEKFEPLAPSCMVNSFSVVDLVLSIDGERIESLEQVQRFRQKLDMKGAAFTTSFDYENKASIVYTLRALRSMPYTALLEVTITARQPITIASDTLLEAPEGLVDVHRYDNVIYSYKPVQGATKLIAASAKGPSGVLTIAAAQSYIFHEPLSAPLSIERKGEGLMFSKQMPAGATYRFALVGSMLTSAHVADPLGEAQRLTTYAAVNGVAELIVQHEKAWAQLWQSDIILEGDDGTQRDVRSMLYHLYSFIREGSGYSIPPMGLTRTRDGYLGHIFWDAEIWMLPALLALHPELARTMLDYRYARLPAARRNAWAHGLRGAKFPWESTGSGDEDIWASSALGTRQLHITADIGIAAWNYFRVTQDREWLREKGYPLIKETADFWVSRVERNGPGRYDISGVVAADEYAENVTNNAYTNGAAKENLAAATAAARILGMTPDPDWENVRQNIPILRFPNGVTRLHATYDGEASKQADVNLLAYPLHTVTDPKAIHRDLEYYSRFVDEFKGPAMTKSVFAILYQRLGMPDKAFQAFQSGYYPNRRPPFGVIAECATCNNPYFATGAGGLLQAMLYGFGGLHITDEGLVHQPGKLPREWKSLTVTGVVPDKRSYVIKQQSAIARKTHADMPAVGY